MMAWPFFMWIDKWAIYLAKWSMTHDTTFLFAVSCGHDDSYEHEQQQEEEHQDITSLV